MLLSKCFHYFNSIVILFVHLLWCLPSLWDSKFHEGKDLVCPICVDPSYPHPSPGTGPGELHTNAWRDGCRKPSPKTVNWPLEQFGKEITTARSTSTSSLKTITADSSHLLLTGLLVKLINEVIITILHIYWLLTALWILLYCTQWYAHRQLTTGSPGKKPWFSHLLIS